MKRSTYNKQKASLSKLIVYEFLERAFFIKINKMHDQVIIQAMPEQYSCIISINEYSDMVNSLQNKHHWIYKQSIDLQNSQQEVILFNNIVNYSSEIMRVAGSGYLLAYIKLYDSSNAISFTFDPRDRVYSTICTFLNEVTTARNNNANTNHLK